MTANSSEELRHILIVDGEIISRHAIAEYLRHCGYSVVEASNTDEAYAVFAEASILTDIVLLAVTGKDTREEFELAKWISENRPEISLKFAGGIESTVRNAAELCDNGPHLKRPYEPEMVVDYIKRMRAKVQ